MKKPTFNDALEDIVAMDDRYDTQAYHFIREALDYTIKQKDIPADGPGRHVSGGTLLDGIRSYSIREFGPMARTVFRTWGVTRCEDFGELVFNLVDYGILGKTDDDKREDFANGFDFDEAFVKPYLPEITGSN